MPTRTKETTVTFEHPFTLAVFNGQQPAGTYLLEINEEEINGLSISVHRRTATLLHTPAIGTTSPVRQVFPVDAGELEAALAADGSPPGKG